MQTIKVVSDGTSSGTTLYFNGTDISTSIRKITWECDASNGIATATIIANAEIEVIINKDDDKDLAY